MYEYECGVYVQKKVFKTIATKSLEFTRIIVHIAVPILASL